MELSMHAAEAVTFGVENTEYRCINHHAPVISLGMGKILEFDNQFENVSENGVSFVLYNNVWGTNFPLWYEDNASFDFTIKI